VTRRVCIIPGDDAAPEAVLPSLAVLKAMELDIDYLELPTGEQGQARYGDSWAKVCREAIDACDTTLFGSTSGKTPALGYLRWQKGTYANVRPVKYIPGAKSPLSHPDGIDFVIIRENMEDMYIGVEGDLGSLKPLSLVNRLTRKPIAEQGGRFALKVITEENTRRIADYACRLALKRRAQGKPGRLTAACKYNMLPQTDGLFRRVAAETAKAYPDVAYEDYIVDDFARRIVAAPNELDVVLLPNLYGDILSDEAAALVGGLGVAPSACYSDDFAYFEPVHGTAPDIAGRHIINPTSTLLSAVMMLDYLGLSNEAAGLQGAVEAIYAEGRVLTPDQGGNATSDEFCRAVRDKLL
jgi:isocitrate/isopropylmalate dehydrogenase